MTTKILHGYSAYTHGCRCETCRKAKAAYMARVRAAGQANARAGRAPAGVTHGSRSAYEEHGCRCGPCCDRQAARHRAEYALMKQRRTTR